MEPQITLPISKFKEILLNSWSILPQEKQEELLALGLYPKREHITHLSE